MIAVLLLACFAPLILTTGLGLAVLVRTASERPRTQREIVEDAFDSRPPPRRFRVERGRRISPL